jgi:hypothetical protein
VILKDGRVVEEIQIVINSNDGKSDDSDWWFHKNYQKVEKYFAIDGYFIAYEYEEKEWTLSDKKKDKCRSFKMTRDSYSSKDFKTNILVCSPAADSMFYYVSQTMAEQEKVYFSELEITKKLLTANHLRYQKAEEWMGLKNGYSFYKGGDSSGKIINFVGFAKNPNATATLQEIFRVIEYSVDRERFSDFYFNK